MNPALLSSANQDWSSPWRLVQAIERDLVRRFVLDVCARPDSAKAPVFYAKADDGLSKDWHKDCPGYGLAWCNPPYGDGKIHLWIKKALEQKDFGITTVFLLPSNKTDQRWWHDLVIPKCAVWDILGRVSFVDPETGKSVVGNTQGSKLVLCGPKHPPCLPRSFEWR